MGPQAHHPRPHRRQFHNRLLQRFAPSHWLPALWTLRQRHFDDFIHLRGGDPKMSFVPGTASRWLGRLLAFVRRHSKRRRATTAAPTLAQCFFQFTHPPLQRFDRRALLRDQSPLLQHQLDQRPRVAARHFFQALPRPRRLCHAF
ncbi:hypothetical protein BH20VER1_BH20VER1_10830 [soil metagenome]